MPTTNNSLQERGAEWKATAEASMVVKLLSEAANEPSTKRFVKSRAARIERWQQLAACAVQQISGLQKLGGAVPRRTAPKPKPLASTSVPITHSDAAEAQQSA